MNELHKIEGRDGLYKVEKVKVLYEIKDFGCYYTVENLETRVTEYREKSKR